MTTLTVESGHSARATALEHSEQLVRTHLRATWRYLRMHGASPDEADDLAQESFVIAARKDALDLDPAATATFLRRTARFLFLRMRRNDKSAVLLADAVDELWALDCAHDHGDAKFAALRRCLAELAPKAARAVDRAYGLDGDTPTTRAALAQELGMQENGIKTLMQRARKQLRDCLERRQHDD